MREVSSKATRILFEALSRAGVDPRRVVEGLPTTVDEICDPGRRVDWDLFAAVCDRVEDACAGALSLEEVGERMLLVPSFEFLRRAGQLVVTPRQLYTVAAHLMAPALFANVTLRHTWLPEGRLAVLSEIAPGYRPSSAFFRISNGNIVALPRLLDLPAATLDEATVSGWRSRTVLVPPRSHTVAAKVARGARTLFGLGDAFRGVARQQGELEASLESLRSSRRELRELIERLPEGVMIHHDGILRWANVAMIGLLGYRTIEEIKGRNILEFLVPDERPVVAAEIARCQRPVGEARRDYRIVRPDGTERRLQAGATQHVEFEGETSRLVVVRDVTEEYRLREQLALADRMASIGTVAAGVAHEINNPLAYVHMNLEVALRELGPREGTARTSSLAECVRSAMEGTERVRGIVRNLKTLSRADEDDLEAVDLPALLDSTLAFANSALVLKARVVRRYGAAPPALAAQGRLGQVFLNLLLNAADAIPEGAPARHEVLVSTAMDADGRAVVEIADTGAGIPRELAGRVFDPFFTTKASGAGTGLGLAICHRLVTGFGGEITFSSNPGGTTFRVVLPPAPAAEPLLLEPESAPPSRRRLLIVDDEPALLRSLCALLGQAHDVVAASSGREALDVLRGDRRFDAVLADLMMANLTGMDLYEAVRGAHPGLEQRIVFMTGGAFSARGREFLAQVPNRCIEKPFATDELLATLGELVGARAGTEGVIERPGSGQQ